MHIGKLNRRLVTSVALLLSSTALLVPVAAHAQSANAPGVGSGVVVWDGSDDNAADGTITNTATGPSNGVYATDASGDISGATIAVQGTSASTAELSSGIRAIGGSTVTVSDSSVSMLGTAYTRGILAVDSTVDASDTDISTVGDRSHAVHAFGASAITLDGGAVSTTGANSFGLYALNAGALVTATGVDVGTSGTNGFGLFAENGGSVRFADGSIETTGNQGHGAVAGAGGSIDISDSSIETSADNTSALIADQAGGVIHAGNVDITTNGFYGFGAYANASGGDTAAIILNGGSITTANNTGEGTQNGDGSRAYALYALGDGARIAATGTDIETFGQRAYGAYAVDGAQVSLTDLDITTHGFMGYGVYSRGAGSVLTTNGVDVTTTGQVGNAGWAYDHAILNLNGGNFLVQGEENSEDPHESADGLLSLGNATINATGISLVTQGANSSGLSAGGEVGPAPSPGTINLVGSSVRAEGINAQAASLAWGSTVTVTDSQLTSVQGAGVVLNGSATVSLVGSSLVSAQQSFVSNLDDAGQTQSVTIGKGSTVTRNNGTLLLVNRTDGGSDGSVDLVLGAGSVTRGDIIDTDAKTAGGGTDVTLEQGADFQGQTRGVANFQAAPGGSVSFQGEAQIGGDLSGESSHFTFSQEGGSIGGNVALTQNSSTTGGSISTPVTVAGNVAVDQTSTFGGNWNVTGNVDSSGKINPGNSVGVIAVGGNLTLTPSSVYAVEIDAAGNSDRINVGGTALLDGTVSVTPLGGFKVQTPYTILTAASLGGTTFDGVTFSQSSAFVTPSLAYDPTSVTLTIGRNGLRFASVAQSSNQAAVGDAVDSLPLTGPIANAIAFASIDDARRAFDSLSGEVHASLKTGLIEDSRFVRDAAIGRIRTAFGGPESASTTSGPGETPDPQISYAEPTIWGQGFGSWGHTDGDGNAAELDRDTGGFLAGIDGMLTDHLRLGVLGGYSHSDLDVDARAASADVDSYHLGLYAGTRIDNVGIRAGASYTWHDIDTDRAVAVPGFAEGLSADYDADTAQLFGEVGYSLDLGTAVVEPFAGLAYVNLDVDGFDETGGVTALSSNGGDTDTTFSTLGLRASDDLDLGGQLVTASGTLAWRHAFDDRSPSTTLAFAAGNAFTVEGVPIAEDAAVLELGLTARLSQAASLGVAYNGQFGDDAEDNGVRASFSYRF